MTCSYWFAYSFLMWQQCWQHVINMECAHYRHSWKKCRSPSKRVHTHKTNEDIQTQHSSLLRPLCPANVSAQEFESILCYCYKVLFRICRKKETGHSPLVCHYFLIIVSQASYSLSTCHLYATSSYASISVFIQTIFFLAFCFIPVPTPR